MKIPRNPYLNRSMIRSPDAFYGRRKEVMRLATRIGADPPQSVAIVGDRRIGKSSLLSYIAHRDVVADYLDEPDKALFVYGLSERAATERGGVYRVGVSPSEGAAAGRDPARSDSRSPSRSGGAAPSGRLPAHLAS